MEQTTQNVQPKTETPTKRRISLSAPTPKTDTPRIRVPRLWDSVKDATTKAVSPVTERLPSPRNIHAMSTQDVAESSFNMADRIASETTGAITGVTRILTGSVVGFAGGLVAGLRGVDPIELKKLRMAPDSMERIGTYLHEEIEYESEKDKKGHRVQVVQLERDLALQPCDFETTFDLRTSRRTRLRYENGTKVDAVVFPITPPGSHALAGFVVCLDDDSRAVYLWVDEPAVDEED